MDYLKESTHRSFLIRDLLGLESEKGLKSSVSKNVSPVESVYQIKSATNHEIHMRKYSTSNSIKAHQQPKTQLHHGDTSLMEESRAIYKILAENCLPTTADNAEPISFISTFKSQSAESNPFNLSTSKCDHDINNQPLALVTSADYSKKVSHNSNEIQQTKSCSAKNNKDHILHSRRNRTIFYEYQLIGLERRFDSNKYLTTADRIKIAKLLNLSQLQVKTWYQVSKNETSICIIRAINGTSRIL